jgi:uncharacterized membrane protein
MREGYHPLDTIRSSYHLQSRKFQFDVMEKSQPGNLFEENKNAVSQTAWACVVYSMVPYLGILFIPFAFIISGAGLVVSQRRPQLGGRKLALACIGVSILILGIQLLLWWLLYVIPELGVKI